MVKRVMIAALAACYLVLVGCNTMAGLGRDIEKGGDKLEDSANRANNNKR